MELTEEQKKQVLELANKGELRTKIAKMLKIDYRRLKKFLDEENIPIKKLGIPYEFYEPIFQLYLSGLTIRQIHDNYYPQFTADQINYILRQKGITRPNGKQVVLNRNYFETVDTEEKAYWLGLLFADGCVMYLSDRKSWRIQLTLMPQDKYLLEKFLKDIGSNLKVKTYINNTGFQKKDGSEHRMSVATVHSKKMAKDLQKYGVIPNKSLKVNKIPSIPENLIRHFIRGFFDGNGSVTYGKYKDCKTPRFLFYSTYDFCESLSTYFNEKIGLVKVNVVKQKQYKVSFITYGSFSSVQKLYNFLYKDATIFMKRKQRLAEEYISEYRDNHAA